MRVKLTLLITTLTILISLGTISLALASEIVGTWVYTETSEDGWLKLTFTFNTNGTLKFTELKILEDEQDTEGSWTATYETDGNTLWMWIDGNSEPDEIPFKIEGDKLLLSGGEPMVFLRTETNPDLEEVEVMWLKGSVRISLSQDIYNLYMKDCDNCEIEITDVLLYITQNSQLRGYIGGCNTTVPLSDWSGGRSAVKCSFKDDFGLMLNEPTDVRFQVYANILKNGTVYDKIGGRTSFQIIPDGGTIDLDDIHIIIDRKH